MVVFKILRLKVCQVNALGKINVLSFFSLVSCYSLSNTWSSNLNILKLFILSYFCICILVAYRQSIFNMDVVLAVHTKTRRANHLDLFAHQGSRRKSLRVNTALFTAENRTFLCDLLAQDSLGSVGSQTWYYKSWASEIEYRSTLVT